MQWTFRATQHLLFCLQTVEVASTKIGAFLHASDTTMKEHKARAANDRSQSEILWEAPKSFGDNMLTEDAMWTARQRLVELATKVRFQIISCYHPVVSKCIQMVQSCCLAAHVQDCCMLKKSSDVDSS